MKKTLRVLLIAMLCLMMALPAGATASLYRGNVNADRFIDGTTLLRVKDSTGYGLSTPDGQMLTGTIYSNFTTDEGFIICRQETLSGLNVYGVMDQTGKLIIPFAYNIIKIDGNFGIAIAIEEATSASYDYESFSGDAFYNTLNVGIFNMSTAAKIADLTRDQYLDFDVVNNCINIQDRSTGVITTYDESFTALGTVDKIYDEDFAPARFETYRENGQYGVKDTAGNIIMQPSFQSVYYNSMYNGFEVSTGSAEGLVDVNGNLVLPAEYDDIKGMTTLPMTAENKYRGYGYLALGQYYCAVKDGKMCYVDVNGNTTFGPKYSKDIVSLAGASFSLQDLDGNLIIVAADGVETTVTGYERITYINGCSGYYYRVSNADGKYGIIDWHGEEVLPCEYSLPYFSGDGRYVLLSKDYKTYDLYELTYPTAAPAAPQADAAAAEAPAADAAPAQSAPAAATGTNAAAVQLINSAITLLNSDAATNGATAVSLLTSASSLIADPAAAGLVTSASTLLSSDAAGNCAAAISLLQSAVTMLP